MWSATHFHPANIISSLPYRTRSHPRPQSGLYSQMRAIFRSFGIYFPFIPISQATTIQIERQPKRRYCHKATLSLSYCSCFRLLKQSLLSVNKQKIDCITWEYLLTTYATLLAAERQSVKLNFVKSHINRPHKRNTMAWATGSDPCRNHEKRATPKRKTA